MPEIMHTAKILAHGKIPFSGSVGGLFFKQHDPKTHYCNLYERSMRIYSRGIASAPTPQPAGVVCV